jgi:DNA-binding MarR family transcriptional regulator
VRSLLAEAMEGSGLRPDEYAVYSALFEFEPISPSDVAAMVGMPPTTVSHYIRAMRERGHLREMTNPQDTRSRMLSLTAAGRRAHRRANAAFEEAYRRFVDHVGDERAVNRALLEVEAAAEDALVALRNESRAQTG